MIKKLHPTLKACACGFIGTRSQLYNHLRCPQLGATAREFFTLHGEVPLNEDDPRLDTTIQLERSLTQPEPADIVDHRGWPGDGSGEDDFADHNQNEASDYP
jgi:hypothetical protein